MVMELPREYELIQIERLAEKIAHVHAKPNGEKIVAIMGPCSCVRCAAAAHLAKYVELVRFLRSVGFDLSPFTAFQKGSGRAWTFSAENERGFEGDGGHF